MYVLLTYNSTLFSCIYCHLYTDTDTDTDNSLF